MRALNRCSTALAAAALAAACAPLGTPGDLPAPADAKRAGRGAWVVHGSEMIPSLSVLDGMRSRFPGMHIRRNGSCPDILIRGHNSIESSNAPRVYVDGLRASDSCILNSLRAGDVAQVEVYPTGHTWRAGYLSDPNGLVLVFTRQARQSR